MLLCAVFVFVACCSLCTQVSLFYFNGNNFNSCRVSWKPVWREDQPVRAWILGPRFVHLDSMILFTWSVNETPHFIQSSFRQTTDVMNARTYHRNYLNIFQNSFQRQLKIVFSGYTTVMCVFKIHVLGSKSFNFYVYVVWKKWLILMETKFSV